MKKTLAILCMALLIAVWGVMPASAASSAVVESFDSYSAGDITKDVYTWAAYGVEIKVSIVDGTEGHAYRVDIVKGGGWVVVGVPIPQDKNDWTNVDTVEFYVDATHYLKGDTSDTGTGYEINLIDGKGEKFKPDSNNYAYSINLNGVLTQMKPGGQEVWLDDSMKYADKVKIGLSGFKSSEYQDSTSIQATGTMQMKGFREFRVGFQANKTDAGKYIIIDSLRVYGKDINVGGTSGGGVSTAPNTSTAPPAQTTSTGKTTGTSSKAVRVSSTVDASSGSTAPSSETPSISSEDSPTVSATSSAASDTGGTVDHKFPIGIVIAIVIVVLLAGGGTTAFFLIRKKKLSQ